MILAAFLGKFGHDLRIWALEVWVAYLKREVTVLKALRRFIAGE
jgi:hypothetical protein